MQQYYQFSNQEMLGNQSYADIKKGKLDLVLLRYMARRIHLIIRQLDQPIPVSQPLLYTLQERHGRTHRIAIYKQQELVQRDTLTFVGFISRKRKPLHESIVKVHIKSAPLHQYAAYSLADSYYEWIRLHNGVMPEGLDHTEMLLQRT